MKTVRRNLLKALAPFAPVCRRTINTPVPLLPDEVSGSDYASGAVRVFGGTRGGGMADRLAVICESGVFTLEMWERVHRVEGVA